MYNPYNCATFNQTPQQNQLNQVTQMNIYSANITVVIKDKPLQTKVFESSPFVDGKTVYRGYRIIKVEKIKVIGVKNSCN